MKKTKFLACLLALATVAGAASALADSRMFSLGAGVQYWNAKDADLIDKDGLGGGGIVFRLRPIDYLGIDFRAGAVGVWNSDTWRTNGTKYKTETTFYCIPLELGLVAMLPLNDVFTVYAGPGVGYYYYDVDIKTTSRHHHHYHSEWEDHIRLEDDFGWYALAGVNVRLAPCFSLFGEVRYTDTETSLKHMDDSAFDASGVGGQVGFLFDF